MFALKPLTSGDTFLDITKKFVDLLADLGDGFQSLSERLFAQFLEFAGELVGAFLQVSENFLALSDLFLGLFNQFLDLSAYLFDDLTDLFLDAVYRKCVIKVISIQLITNVS